MGSEPAYKRKQYLVDHQYQLRFVTRVFTVVLLIAVISSLISTCLIWANLYRATFDSQAPLISALMAVSITLLVELLIAIPVVFFVGVQQSHRVVGPISRIKRMLELLGSGDFSQRITLRKGDALEDLAASLNHMAASLQQKFPGSPG